MEEKEIKFEKAVEQNDEDNVDNSQVQDFAQVSTDTQESGNETEKDFVNTETQNKFIGLLKGVVEKITFSRKNVVISAVVIVAVILLLVANGSKNVSSYKRDAEFFCDEVLNAAVNLEDIGNEVKSEWYDYIYDTWSSYDSVDEAVDGAHENMSSEVDAAISSKDEIDKMYKKLKKPANKNEELVEICEAVKNLYEEYENLYEIVINPWGNYNDFSDDFRNYDGSTVDAYEELKDLFE